MIITTPCLRPYQHHPGVSHQSRQLRAPSGDYAKAVPGIPRHRHALLTIEPS